MPADDGDDAKAKKAQNLLSRFPIVDLAKAVALEGKNRHDSLKRFVDSFPPGSYAPTRSALSMIYNVQKPLFETPPPPWSAVEKYIKHAAAPGIVDMNLDATRCLFDYVRTKNYVATECESQVLRVRLRQVVKIDLDFYVTDGDRLIFQFPFLRRQAISDSALAVLVSIR
jgi:hypothetical protein